MSEDLKKMKVTIEGDTKSLKKELGSARQETRRSSAVIRKEIEKIKQSMSGKLPKVPQNISTTMRQSFQNIKVGAPFSAMAQDVKQYVKEAQLAAGIKVHTEEYEQTERDIERVSQSLEGLKQKKRDLMNSSGGTERSKAIANVKEQIAAAEQQLEKYQAHRQYMQFSNTDSERAYTGKLSDGNSFETVKGILDTIIVAIENTDWQQVGEKVREVLVNIDWKGIVSRLSEAIGAAFGGFAAFIGGLIGDAFTSAKEYFEGKIEECGGNVVLGIFKGIIDAIKGIAAWIKDNIFTPFIDGFKNAFGIHSPSTVMRQQGIYIIEGLLEGAKNKLSDLLSWFGQLPGKIKAKLGDAKAWIKSKGSDAIQGLKSGWEAVKESRFLKYVANMKNEVFTKIGNIKEKVTSKGNDIVSGMKNGFSSHWSSFTETLGNIPSKISKAIPNLFSIGKNAIQGFANGFGSVHIPLPHVSVSWNRHSVGPVSFSTPSFGLNWYAKGGFPENGEMFIARENGPEMVGRMGSRNTVANNNQIIEGIKKGVFEAVVEAFDMSGSMNNDKDKDVIVNLTIKADSETLYKVVRKGQKKYDNRYHVVATI